MKIDESDWHDLKDKLYILKKRIAEHVEERQKMIKILKLSSAAGNAFETDDVQWRASLLLKEIGELE